MKRVIYSATLLLLGSSIFTFCGYAEEPAVKLLYKDGKVVQVPDSDVEEKEPASDKTTFVDQKEHTHSLTAINEYRKSRGLPPGPVFFYERGDPTAVDKFEIPPDQRLPGCMYLGGYSFPYKCYDRYPGDPNQVIFEIEKDTQAVLDTLKERYQITGEYNIIPADYGEEEDDEEVSPTNDETGSANPSIVEKPGAAGAE